MVKSTSLGLIFIVAVVFPLAAAAPARPSGSATPARHPTSRIVSANEVVRSANPELPHPELPHLQQRLPEPGGSLQRGPQGVSKPEASIQSPSLDQPPSGAPPGVRLDTTPQARPPALQSYRPQAHRAVSQRPEGDAAVDAPVRAHRSDLHRRRRPVRRRRLHQQQQQQQQQQQLHTPAPASKQWVHKTSFRQNETTSPTWDDPFQLPMDFNWRAYLRLNPEVEELGLYSADDAMRHYLSYGRPRNYVYKDFVLGLRYTACGGLANQLYSHVAALTLAHYAKANTVVWPPVLEHVSTDGCYKSASNATLGAAASATYGGQKWVHMDADQLFDLRAMHNAVRDQLGFYIIKHPPDIPLPNLTSYNTAYQAYPVSTDLFEFQVRLNQPIYLSRSDPNALARQIAELARKHVQQTGKQPTSMLVDLPCTLFMLDLHTLPVVEDIARVFHFSAHMNEVSGRVIRAMRQASPLGYNGLHMRIENDAADWFSVMGGKGRWWKLYKETISEAGMVTSIPTYIATGLIRAGCTEPQARAEFRGVTDDLRADRLVGRLLFKELYLTATEMAGLANVEESLVDLMVLRHSNKFAGLSLSTISFMVYQLRMLDGRVSRDSKLMMASAVGADELLFSGGILTTQRNVREPDPLLGLCMRPCGVPCFTACPEA